MSEKIRTILIDIETYSSVSLAECGVYKYAGSNDFEILLFGYSLNGDEVKVVDIAQGEKLPEKVLEALTDDTVLKWSHNAIFERICLSAWLKKNYPQYFKSYSIDDKTVKEYLDPASWRCSQIWCAYMGLPLSLEGAGAVFGLDEQKMKEGKDLIRYFCRPCDPTKSNGGRTRDMPTDAPEKWDLFKSYNKRDVEVEMSIQQKLQKFPVPDFIWEEYTLDQEINDRGILVDLDLVGNALRFDAISRDEITASMKKQTGMDNPNSVAQMKQWLADKGIKSDSLGKKEVKELIRTVPSDVAEVLRLRQQLAKSSVKKYRKMEKAACADGRARGMYQFYGANRSGRWAGRLIQLQNLPRNTLPDLTEARSVVKSGDYEFMSMLYEDIPDTLSQLIRTAFVPRPGFKFIVADFSSIEARVLSFLAQEQWRMDAFANGEDIYSMTASRMFGVPVEKHGQNADLRQKGKIAELACIAEGQLVLTDKGLIPIENVTTDEKVWDGENWVRHGGVIYKGEREVITYEGLTATPDHVVWVEGASEPIQFGVAASCGARLLQTGDGRKAIRMGKDYKTGKTMEQENEPLLCSDTMSGMRKHSMAGSQRPDQRKIKGLPALLPAASDSKMAGETACCGQAALRKSVLPRLGKLRGTRYQIQFSKRNGSGSLFDPDIWDAGQTNGNRPDQHKRELRTRQFTICNASGKLRKSAEKRSVGVRPGILAICALRGGTKALQWGNKGRDHTGCGNSSSRKTEKLENHKRTARLYDIRDAGPNHRFTVSGKLVHNCGYGGAVGALKKMGALEMGIPEEELRPIVKAWRSSNPRIVQLWQDVGKAVLDAVKRHGKTESHGIRFTREDKFLFITLPSGRRLTYANPRIEQNCYGSECVTYEGISPEKKWMRLESYGPKFVEQITQGISRDILAYAMKTLRNCFIVGHVHDELIIECSRDVSVATVCEQMGRTPPWMPGLQIRADGYECNFYQKA